MQKPNAQQKPLHKNHRTKTIAQKQLQKCRHCTITIAQKPCKTQCTTKTIAQKPSHKNRCIKTIAKCRHCTITIAQKTLLKTHGKKNHYTRPTILTVAQKKT